MLRNAHLTMFELGVKEVVFYTSVLWSNHMVSQSVYYDCSLNCDSFNNWKNDEEALYINRNWRMRP